MEVFFAGNRKITHVCVLVSLTQVILKVVCKEPGENIFPVQDEISNLFKLTGPLATRGKTAFLGNSARACQCFVMVRS